MDFSGELTDIQRFYKNSTVFLTGATGYIGKLFLEKVLRSLPIKHVYVLVRVKKDVPPEERFEKIFENPIFGPLKRLDPNFRQRVSMIHGDCALPDLGLTHSDRNLLIKEVDVIFHCAATVRFDQKLSTATFINVRATRDVLCIAKEIKKLKTFVHVSTAYSNAPLSEIEEKFYEPRITAEKLIAVCENLDDESLTALTPTLIADWPNTYTFTKQVAEDLVNREGKTLPLCVVRPTIVISTAKEPLKSFMDNIFTLTGVTVGNAMGVTRIQYYKVHNLDVVPADFVVNECIAAGWNTGEMFMKKSKNGNEVPIYHVTNIENPISIDDIFDIIDQYARPLPSVKVLMYPLYFRTTCYYNYIFFRFFLHTMVAYILDLFLKLRGKKPIMVDAMKKIHKFQEVLMYFMTREFFFHNENTNKLLKKMSFKDRELFDFDIPALDWNEYFESYTKGVRVYLLQDPLDTIPEGQKHMRKLKILFFVGVAVFLTVFYVTSKIFLFKILPCLCGFVKYCICGERSK